MIRLNQHQFRSLRHAAAEHFVDRALQHIRVHFANHWRVVGADALRPLVRLAMARAAEHGFNAQREVCQYLNLMLLLGADFDRDPLLPWAGDGLRSGLHERSGRLARVYDRALAFLDASAGRRNEHLEAALQRMLAGSHWRCPPVPAGQFEFVALSALRWVYPQRAAAVGDACLQAAARDAAGRAVTLGLVEQSQALLYLGLAYMLGSGFAHDPQFPWAAKALQTTGPEPADAREQRLRDAAFATLRAWLQVG